MKILFLGHEDFGNRGCEALVRSIVYIIKQRAPDTQFLLPSRTPDVDLAHWPELKEAGVTLIGETLFARHLGWWGRLTKALPPLQRLDYPPFRPDRETMAALKACDQVIITGGDIFSLEYGLPSLFFWVGIARWARRLGKPVHLWAASVGPFRADPITEQKLKRHLSNDYTSISVRETATFDYLAGLGISDVHLVTDPAFNLQPEAHGNAEQIFSDSPDGVLGFNVSPLVRSLLPDASARSHFDDQVVRFLRAVTLDRGMPVLLVPHVDPYDGSAGNSDSIYMKGLMEKADLPPTKLAMLPSNLNAAQLKYSISRCRFFIGARTHATIAAISQRVPTISIAYSIKAVGINRDLFGDLDVVLPTPQVSYDTLQAALDRLLAHEDEIKALLSAKLPVWRERGHLPLNLLLGER